MISLLVDSAGIKGICDVPIPRRTLDVLNIVPPGPESCSCIAEALISCIVLLGMVRRVHFIC
jgi:hypothetical protein